MSPRLIWFFNTLVRVCVAEDDGKDGISVLEHRAPFGDSPPLHIHHTEDEIFRILEGEFRFQMGDTIQRFEPGAVCLAPKGIAHTYRIESSTGGRWETVTAHGDFERFIRAVGREAEGNELPPPAALPSPEALEKIGAIARTFGIDLVGGPLD